MKKEHHKRTPQEKEKILLDIQSMGANTIDCRLVLLTADWYC